jgi:glycosyltransferase involved in cell wall biosynthesis
MISVVIPLYNKALTITRCLNSVNTQSELPDELIIINDGSQDDGLEIVKNWVAKNTKIECQIIDQLNQGVSYTRNKGVALSRNNFVAFLDADDEWHKDFIFYAKKNILRNQDISLVTCRHKIVDEILGTYMPKQQFGNKEVGLIENYSSLARSFPIVNTSKSVVNKTYFKKVGGFPEDAKVSEDLFLWIRLSDCAPIAYTNKLLVTIYQAPDQSRNLRIGQIPYPIKFYSSTKYKGKIDKDLYLLLWSIHLKHILASSASNKKEAQTRIIFGLKLFKLRGFLLFGLMLIPQIIFEKYRIFRRRQLINEYELQ